MPRREGDVFLFGTAIFSTPVNSGAPAPTGGRSRLNLDKVAPHTRSWGEYLAPIGLAALACAALCLRLAFQAIAQRRGASHSRHDARCYARNDRPTGGPGCGPAGWAGRRPAGPPRAGSGRGAALPKYRLRRRFRAEDAVAPFGDVEIGLHHVPLGPDQVEIERDRQFQAFAQIGAARSTGRGSWRSAWGWSRRRGRAVLVGRLHHLPNGVPIHPRMDRRSDCPRRSSPRGAGRARSPRAGTKCRVDRAAASPTGRSSTWRPAAQPHTKALARTPLRPIRGSGRGRCGRCVRRARETVIGLRRAWPAVSVSWPTLSSDRLLSRPEFRLNIMRSTSSFTARLLEVAGNVEAMLEALLSDEVRPGEIARPPRLMEAMRHAALGRRQAPAAVPHRRDRATARAATTAGALRAGCAVELLHCYSLVHDDLPSMDDDDLRRGRPTVHKAFDEATAILAGDALQTLAFEVLADPATDADPAIRAELVLRLARASGVGGMVGGQMLDLAAEGRYGAAIADQDGVRRLQAMKTGAILAFAVEAGAVIGAGERCRSRGPRGLRASARRRLPDRRRHSRPGGLAEAMGKRTGKDRREGQGDAGGPPRDGAGPSRMRAPGREADAALARFGAPAETLRRRCGSWSSGRSSPASGPRT